MCSKGSSKDSSWLRPNFDSAAEAAALTIPDFIAREVSSDARFTGGLLVHASRQDVETWLSNYGLTIWSQWLHRPPETFDIKTADAFESKRVRQDVFHRLNVVLLTMPPPRECRKDTPVQGAHFIQKFCGKSLPGTCEAFFSRARILLENDPWPRNVEKLENVIERAVVSDLTS